MMLICRYAEKEDFSALIELLRELTALEEDFDFDEDKHRQGLDLLTAAPEDRACVIVAELSGKVVGMCTGQAVFSTAMGGVSIWVEDVVVTGACRGRGIGKSLLRHLQEWAVGIAGAKRLQLWADMDNKSAIDFYNHNGWFTANGIVIKKLL